MPLIYVGGLLLIIGCLFTIIRGLDKIYEALLVIIEQQEEERESEV